MIGNGYINIDDIHINIDIVIVDINTIKSCVIVYMLEIFRCQFSLIDFLFCVFFIILFENDWYFWLILVYYVIFSNLICIEIRLEQSMYQCRMTIISNNSYWYDYDDMFDNNLKFYEY